MLEAPSQCCQCARPKLMTSLISFRGGNPKIYYIDDFVYPTFRARLMADVASFMGLWAEKIAANILPIGNNYSRTSPLFSTGMDLWLGAIYNL